MTKIDSVAIINGFIKVINLIKTVKEELRSEIDKLKEKNNNDTKAQIEQLLADKTLVPKPLKAGQVLKTKESDGNIVVYWADDNISTTTPEVPPVSSDTGVSDTVPKTSEPTQTEEHCKRSDSETESRGTSDSSDSVI